MKTLFTFLIALLSLNASILFAQDGTQTVKGIISDKDSEMPLIGAAVVLIGSEPLKGTVTDMDGRFELQGVPVGRQAFKISYIGYLEQTIPNILVTAGKQVELQLLLTESVDELNEVEIVAETKKTENINEMAMVSTRQLTTEQVSRFSGGRNDISRLAGNLAGVSTADDSRNDIVIRGNSPTGLLWRLEGIPIPNPNHFSTLGTTGGPVSMINPNMLENSEFMTGAFPSEYGNATAGVFDLGFRSGNKEDFEFTLQMAAFSGLEAMAEGPLSKKKTSSFLVGYRYALTAIGPTGTSATPYYQDLSMHLDFANTKAGKFSIFGIGGLSNIDFKGSETKEDDLFADPNEDSYVTSKMGVIGVKHNYIINESSYLRTIISASYAQSLYDEDNYLETGEKIDVTHVDDVNSRYVISSYYNKKFSPKFSMRTGILNTYYNLKLNWQDRSKTPDWVLYRDYNDGMNLTELYIQTKYRFADNLTLHTGLHGQVLSYNGSWMLEPRAGISWNVKANQTLSFAYGLHSQMQPLPVYFYQGVDPNGNVLDGNKDLDFTRSHHFVLGYDFNFAKDWRLKTEAYYQLLQNVPVEAFASSFSVLNAGADFVFPEKANLLNNGIGYNYGLEITLEKFFSKGYYGLLTTSLYNSRYEGSDNISRNTAFNNNIVVNFLAGKEFKIGREKRNAITADIKLTTSGGRFYTPVDLAASQAAGEEILQESNAFSERNPAYFRLDTKFGYRLNSKKRKFSQQFYVDLNNVTNYQNVFANRYNEQTSQVNTVYQQGFFPDILYRIQF